MCFCKNEGEYLLENYISFLTDSNLPLNRINHSSRKSEASKFYVAITKILHFTNREI
jgi:hypothetical protein